MTSELVTSREIQDFLDRVAGLDQVAGDDRMKRIVRRVVGDLFATIDEFDVSEDEFWKTVNFLAAAAPEYGLIAAGFGFEHFLDIRMEVADHKVGLSGGTPRTIEGPLYVNGAPRSTGFARLDDGTDEGEVLVMHGRVVNVAGKPIVGAIIDVWHANTLGNYSYFDSSQSTFNLRRQIETDADGRYKFRSVLPSGYAVPPGGSTEQMLDGVGRHGHRPAHIHFFVSAGGYRHLTTQINIDGDPYLYNDFAYATHDDLIPPTERKEDSAAIHAEGLNAPFTEIAFDFVLHDARQAEDEAASTRNRVAVAG